MVPIDSVRSFPAARAFDWLAEGWRLFRLAPGLWLGVAVLVAVITLLLGLVPVVGPLLANLGSLLLFGGMLAMARDVDDSLAPPLARLFAPARTLLAPLLLTTVVLSLAVAALLLVFVAVAGGTAAVAGLTAFKLAPLGGFVAGTAMVLAAAACVLLASGVFWFAPGLVVLCGAGSLASVSLSARGFMRNLGAMLLLSVMFFGLAIAATIPFGLGWLVLLPVISGASYASIKDVFGLSAA